MTTNKITIIGSIIVVLLVISIPTIYKVVKSHQDNLYQVVEEKIITAAKKCYYDKKCKEEKIYLENLYDLEYLDQVSNPITKENYNVKSYVLVNNNKFEFKVKE